MVAKLEQTRGARLCAGLGGYWMTACPPAVVLPGSVWGQQTQIAACTITTLVQQQPTRFESADDDVTNVTSRLAWTCYTLGC